MRRFLILYAFLLSPMVLAEVSPEHVEEMLQQMVKENVISPEEAEKAKVRMKAMTAKQWSDVNDKAVKVAATRAPASVNSNNTIEEAKGADLDSAQFKQIQDDIKNIVPEYKDQ